MVFLIPKNVRQFALMAPCLRAGMFVQASQKPAVAPSPNAWSVRWQPSAIVNGSPVVFLVNPPARLATLSGTWLDHEVSFGFDKITKKWFGLAGTSLETRSGTYTLELKGTTASGREVSFQQKVTVRPAKYPSIAVTVAKKFTEPSPEQLRQIKQDQAVKRENFRSVDPEREWSGRFRPPVNAAISDVFGTRRTFNGKVQSMHQGLDYAVPSGTPVATLNAGRCCSPGRYISKEIASCWITDRVCSHFICIFRNSRSRKVIASRVGKSSV